MTVTRAGLLAAAILLLAACAGLPGATPFQPVIPAFQATTCDDLATEFPHLAEVVAGHVAKVGYDFTAAFEYGLDLILDQLDERRDEA